MRRCAGALAVYLVLTSCAGTLPQEPSTIGSREIFGGIHRRFTDEQTVRYALHLRQTLVARGPQIETAPRVTEIDLTFEERTFAPEGAEPYVTVTVFDANATGPDAQIEREAALGRTLKITYGGDGMSFDLAGRQIGKPGELRMIDAALMAHLLTPVGSQRRITIGGEQPKARSDSAVIPPGWAPEDIRLSGSIKVLDRHPYKQHRSATITNSHRGTAKMDLAVFDDATPATERFDPVTNGFFTSLFASDPAINGSPLKALFLAPAAVIDVFTFVFGCVFTLGFFPGCDDDTQQAGRVTIDMSGPIAFEQTAYVHRAEGIPIASSGKGSLKLEGRLPEPPAPSAGSREAKGARVASALSGAPISIDVTWEFSRELVGPIPDDGLWWLPYSAAAAGLAAIIALIVAWMIRRRSRRAATNA